MVESAARARPPQDSVLPPQAATGRGTGETRAEVVAAGLPPAGTGASAAADPGPTSPELAEAAFVQAGRALIDAMVALGNELGQEASRAGDHLAREGMAVLARSRRDHAACLHDLARADSPFAAWLICSDYLRRSLAFSMVEGQELMAPLRALRRSPRG